MSQEILENFIRADFWANPGQRITSNAPKDLEILGLAKSDVYPFTFEAYVKSESFAENPEGAIPPLIEPFTYTVTQLEGK